MSTGNLRANRWKLDRGISQTLNQYGRISWLWELWSRGQSASWNHGNCITGGFQALNSAGICLYSSQGRVSTRRSLRSLPIPWYYHSMSVAGTNQVWSLIAIKKSLNWGKCEETGILVSKSGNNWCIPGPRFFPVLSCSISFHGRSWTGGCSHRHAIE